MSGDVLMYYNLLHIYSTVTYMCRYTVEGGKGQPTFTNSQTCTSRSLLDMLHVDYVDDVATISSGPN